MHGGGRSFRAGATAFARAFGEHALKGHEIDVDAALFQDVFTGRTERAVAGDHSVVAACLASRALDEAAVYSTLRADR